MIQSNNYLNYQFLESLYLKFPYLDQLQLYCLFFQWRENQLFEQQLRCHLKNFDQILCSPGIPKKKFEEIKKENNNFFDPSHTYFVPTEEGIKDLEMKDPRVGGPKYKTYKQDLFIRFNTVKGYIKTILLDGPLYVKSYQPK